MEMCGDVSLDWLTLEKCKSLLHGIGNIVSFISSFTQHIRLRYNNEEQS